MQWRQIKAHSHNMFASATACVSPTWQDNEMSACIIKRDMFCSSRAESEQSEGAEWTCNQSAVTQNF